MIIKKIKLKNSVMYLISWVLVLCFCFGGLVSNLFAGAASAAQEEIRGVWVSFIDIGEMVQGRTEQEFKNEWGRICKELVSKKIPDVYFHARAFADAFYDSEIFPQSHILTGVQGQGLSYDVFGTAVNIAHENGLKFHAWFNPYRIKSPGESKSLADSNPAKKYLDEGRADVVVKLTNGGVYYNPCSKEAINDCIAAISEVARKYNVDGIHIDDYFYPIKEESFDKAQYEQYVRVGGKLELDDWRRNNVTRLIMRISDLTGEYKVPFSISPGGNFEKVYSDDYADFGAWLRCGLVDVVMPQLYYGFHNSTMNFEKSLKTWSDFVAQYQKKICVGLAAYKIGQEESKWAGERGRHEWVENHDVLKRQVEEIRKDKNTCGFAFFRLANIVEIKLKDEKKITEKESQEQEKIRESVKAELANLMSLYLK